MKVTSFAGAMAATLAFAAVSVFSVSAQSAEVTQIIVPFSPGGTNDVIARIVAEQLTSSGVRETIVVNVPGGSATIGMSQVAQAKPDGYTLGLENITFNVNPYLMKDMPYDTDAAFVPVGTLATVPFVLTVHPDLPARNVADLVTMLKAKPGEYGFSTSGYGSGTHLSTELFMSATGTSMTHVPYKGGSEHVVASLNGQTGVMFASLPSALEFVKSGQLIALAVTSAKPDPRLPGIPTMQESGFAGYEMTEYPSLVAPAGTPKEIVDQINKEVRDALAIPEVQARIEAVGGTVVGGTPEELAAFNKAERTKWDTLVKQNHITVN